MIPHVGVDGPPGAGAAVALRARPARRRRRGRLEPAADALGKDHNIVHARPTRSACREADVAEHDRDPAGPRHVPGARRPAPAGPAQRALPRSADDQPRAASPPTRPSTATATRRQRARCIDTSRLYYNGNSQGGIIGGALTALSPDFTRASLGVPAMNYSVLLHALGRLRHLRGDPRTRPTRTKLARPLVSRPDPDALGPRRAERLRAPDDRPTRCRTRRRTRC